MSVIKVSEIRKNPVALRAVNSESEGYVGLRDSIARSGLLNPISVRSKTEEVDGDTISYYELVDGLHRFSAVLDLGLDEIPVNIVSLDDSEVLEAQIMANIHTIETRPVEYTKQLQRIFASNPTMTVSEMAQHLAKSSSWVSQRLGLLKLDERVQPLVDDGKITVSNAVVLAKLPPEEQLNFVDSAMTTAPAEFVATVQARIAELRQAVKEGREASAPSFSPVPHARKMAELKTELEQGEVGRAMCEQVGAVSAVDGFKLGVAFAIHLDPISLAQQEAEYNEKRRQIEDAKKRRQIERANKRRDEAAAEAAKLLEG